MSDIYFTFINIFLLVVWFKTEAFIEYNNIIKIFKSIFKVKEYDMFRKENPDIDYNTFLLIRYNSFFTRLISCPICLNTWFCILSIPFIHNIFNIFLNFSVSLILYFIIGILIKKYDN
jgi:hypothetical protein